MRPSDGLNVGSSASAIAARSWSTSSALGRPDGGVNSAASDTADHEAFGTIGAGAGEEACGGSVRAMGSAISPVVRAAGVWCSAVGPGVPSLPGVTDTIDSGVSDVAKCVDAEDDEDADEDADEDEDEDEEDEEDGDDEAEETGNAKEWH